MVQCTITVAIYIIHSNNNNLTIFVIIIMHSLVTKKGYKKSSEEMIYVTIICTYMHFVLYLTHLIFKIKYLNVQTIVCSPSLGSWVGLKEAI